MPRRCSELTFILHSMSITVDVSKSRPSRSGNRALDSDAVVGDRPIQSTIYELWRFIESMLTNVSIRWYIRALKKKIRSSKFEMFCGRLRNVSNSERA